VQLLHSRFDRRVSNADDLFAAPGDALPGIAHLPGEPADLSVEIGARPL
jgi:hypothetical protein